MYEGHVTFGDTELINTERLQSYVDHGVVPPGVDVAACTECDGLAEALDSALVPYRTPMLDQAPWVDLDDPDTFDFTGLLPLALTGLDGTTATVEVTETLDGGAVMGRRIHAPRQIGVTALLTGRTSEGVLAGLRWLTTLLHRTCEADDCALGAPVELFSVCPTPLYPQPDLDAEQLEDTLLGWDDPDGGWTAVNGEYTQYDPDLADNVGVFTPYTIFGIDGGSPDFTVDPPLDGGDPSGGWESPEVYDGGDPGPFLHEGDGYVFRDAQLGPLCGPVELVYCLTTLDESAEPVNVTLILIDPTSGNVIEYGPQLTIEFEDECQEPWVLPFGIDLDQWAVGFIADGVVAIAGVVIRHYPLLPPEACIAPYRRIMPAATVTSGPTITDRLPLTDCAEWLKVEWIWTLGSPYKYGTPKPLVIGNGAFIGPPTFVATGVSTTRYGWSEPGTVSTPWNCDPPDSTIVCADDPCAPGWTSPPAPPVVDDPSFAIIGMSGAPLFIMGTTVCIDPSVTPAGESVLTIRLAADDQPKVGVRVRIYDDVQGDCTETDKCTWLAEYLIDYIPAGGIVTIDGTTGEITTLCPGFTEPQPTPVRGDYGGPIKLPVICGDRRILVQTQWMRRYPRECEGVYALNIHEGDLFTSIDLSARED